MNERVMQFRIGMFVIVAGLVLTMLIVWFGESPALLRDQRYLKARYSEAPGVLEGVAVRKSGIRIGEVVNIAFDSRPDQPDGVLVTMALESRYAIREGSVPRLSRSLIGDVTIDLLPGTGQADLALGRTQTEAPIVEGEVAVDPGKALAAATIAFEKAGDTLKSINDAAAGLAKLTQNSSQIENFLKTWTKTGEDVSGISQGMDQFLKTNEGDIRAAVASIRAAGQKLDSTLSPEAQDALRTGIARFSATTARLDSELAELEPLIKDLGANVNHSPTTDFGQSLRRLNRVASDVELLSATLRSRDGKLNTDGSIQKLLTQSDIHDNFNSVATNANSVLNQLKGVIGSLRNFAERVSRDPAVISRGALQR